MRFSSDDIRAFATWSRDCNPLHVDPAFARQTFFGRPIAHGMLSVLAALETAGAPDVAIDSLDIEFRGAVVPDTDYRIDATDAGTITVAPAAGGDSVLSIRTASADTSGEPAATIDEKWLSAIRHQPPPASTRETPASRTIDELAQGAEVVGFYTTSGGQLDAPGAGAHPVLAHVLALSSYVVGMELPGERSLFTRASLRLVSHETGVVGNLLEDGLAYRARVTRFERHFRLLDVQLEVATASGIPIAVGLIRSYVPFSPPHVDVDRLASQLTPEASRLNGRVALVCGGSRGLGAEIAAALALAGCHVYATGRESSGLTPALSSALERRGAHVEFLQGDAADPAWCRATVERIQGAHGRLDVLVLNACAPPSALRLGAEHAASQADYITHNLRLVQVPLAASLAGINASRGAVAYVSSSFVQDAPDGFSHYVAVKQAGEALVRAAQQESPATLACIARPPRLQTSWNDTPAAAAAAIAPERAAIHLVNELAARWGSTGTTVLTEFPPLAAAEPARAPARRDEPAFPLRIAATFTTDPLMPPLAFWLRTLDAGEEIETAPYGQVLQSLLDPGSVLAGRGGLNVVLFRVHDWLHELPEENRESVEFLKAYLADAAADFERAMQAHRGRAAAPTLLLVCPAWSTASREVQALVEATEARLCAALGGLAGLHIAFARDYHERHGVDEASAADPLREQIAHIPYRDAYYDTLATVIARWVHRQRTPARKVVVVDCDNTLWSGVVGEVGAEGIALEPHHLALHDALRTLGRSGVLICLCSKNEDADVWSVFDTRADMRLKREDVVAATINWQPKSENLRSLASRLNLGLDSFVFLDDNPVECAEVRAHCPEVLTLEWPQDPTRARQLLQHAWELEPRGATAEDERRTQMYREEFKRQELRTQTLSFADFIGSLDVDIQIQPLSAVDLKRASQLTLRTNQFNFTTRRRDEGELQRLVDAGSHDVRTVRVKDRFGDYGLVGLLIAEHQPDAVVADTFLLSCRVLGRGVEHRMAAELGRLALAHGVDAVRLRVDPTKRNAPARAFLMSFSGAEPAADGVLESEMVASTLAEFRYVPTEQEAAAADVENDSPASTTSALPVDRIRDREALISRIAFELSDPLRLRAAVEGRSTAAITPEAAASDVDEVVYAAFAATLRVPADTIRTVDRLEALGCDSLKIVEITVALLERYPSLPTTLLFEHKAVSDIVRHVRTLLSPEASARMVSASAVAEAPAAAAPDAAFDVAVVGMHVRCGGADSPAELWAMLSEARSAVGPVPPARSHFLHPLNDSRPYWASLLADPGRFDAEFFGVSPREAEYMDPQLRLFLEVAWGALEDAGCVGADHEPDTGVFAGVMYGDYAHRANIRGTSDNAYRCWEGFSLANRLSQLLGFSGPSLAVDTACSSSGTAMHLACRALAAGDCRVAVVGGVNLILDPDRFGSLGHLGILSPRGKCEPFGAEADGTALGEGAGVVILRPLTDALRRGDRIYGVIKGTGVSTGSGTVGFTAPNPQAQAQAIERSLRAARIDPRTISYVEAHGTGTVLGDPIEVRGLTLAYSKPDLHHGESDMTTRRTLGSIKPNVGHLEAGAAVVGLIKVLLQLQHGMLLPSITSSAPNPQIPFDGITLDVQRSLEPWDRPTAVADGVAVTVPRRAGVSSFGVGGANAHIIVEEPPTAHERATAADRSQHLLTMSAISDTALDEQVSRLRTQVDNGPEIALADLAFSMNVGRQHFGRRVTIRFSDREQLLMSLDELSRGATPKRSTKSDVSGRTGPKVAFLFTGQGSQYAGMGRQLYDTQPVFRAALDRCAAIFDRLIGEPLRDLLFASEDSDRASLLDQTGFTQPALFAFEYALSELWRSWGVRPDVVMGHSVGEIGAMCVAGGLSLEDGLTLIAARGRLMQALPAGGAMTSVMAPEALVIDAIAGVTEQVAIAAINGPGQVVISGVGTVVADVGARLESAGIKTRALTVSHAFHSPLMKPMLSDYEAVVRSIKLRTPEIPFVSCVDGALVTSEVTRPEYWIRQIMDPVRFAAGMSVLERERIDAFVEIGPQPVLLGMGRHCVSDAATADWLPSLRKDVDSWTTLLDSVATLYSRGATIDWKGFDAPYARTRVAAPAYAFTPRQYWLRIPPVPPAATQAVRRTDDTPATGSARSAEAAGPALYQLEWQPQPIADGTSALRTLPRSADNWVIFADRSGVGAELATELTGAGAHALVVVPGKRFERTWDGQYQVHPESLDDLQKLWASMKLDGVSSFSIAHLWSLDATAASPGGVDDVVGVPLVSATNLVRSIATVASAVRAAWFVTRGAVVPVAALLTDRVAVEQAPLWGLGRTIALEHPDLWGGLVDVSPGDDARRDVAALARELLGTGGEDQIALRGEARYVARLTPASLPASGPATIRADATYLITGGTGALGLHVAAWFVAHGARHLTLVARRPECVVGCRGRELAAAGDRRRHHQRRHLLRRRDRTHHQGTGEQPRTTAGDRPRRRCRFGGVTVGSGTARIVVGACSQSARSMDAPRANAADTARFLRVFLVDRVDHRLAGACALWRGERLPRYADARASAAGAARDWNQLGPVGRWRHGHAGSARAIRSNRERAARTRRSGEHSWTAAWLTGIRQCRGGHRLAPIPRHLRGSTTSSPHRQSGGRFLRRCARWRREHDARRRSHRASGDSRGSVGRSPAEAAGARTSRTPEHPAAHGSRRRAGARARRRCPR